MGDAFYEKLPDEIADSIGASDDESIPNRQASASVRIGSIQVRESGRGEVAQDVRVVGLKMTVVATCDEGRTNGVGCSGHNAPLAFIEISWVLMQQRGQDGTSNHSPDYVVGIRGRVSLGIALKSRLVTGKRVVKLFHASDTTRQQKCDWVGCGAESEIELQPGGHRCRVPDIAAVEVWDDAQNSLVLGQLYLRLGNLILRCNDLNVGVVGRKLQFKGRQGKGFPGPKCDGIGGIWLESF